jgi:hypothetical protein
MRELATGVWHWQAAHPEWKPGQTWDQMVSSYAVDTGQGVLLFDPLDAPAQPLEAATREKVIQRLRPLLDLPVEVVLPTHAVPADRSALEHALSL